MTEYTVHFQKGRVVGARSLRMEHVEANGPHVAMVRAKKAFPDWRRQGYRITRVDHFEKADEDAGMYGERLVIDL